LKRSVPTVSPEGQFILKRRRIMSYFENYSKEKLYRLAEDLSNSIADAAWRNNAGKANLLGPTNHMIAAMSDFRTYTNDPCPTCGKNRRDI
jgi:hypothetical protein